MATKDKRIDDYIAKAQPFAQPILKKMREFIHKACPEVTETIKWGMPSFEYKGPMFGMASFKQHCVGGFWKSKLLNDPKNLLGERKAQGGDAMGNLGRMTSIKDLPSDKAIIDFVKQHMKLNEEGIKVEKKPVVKKETIVPKELIAALNKNKKAKATFEKFSPSGKREYTEWITDAKTEATRDKRLAEAIQWMEEGKPRMWKYMKEYKK
ncbi:MAG TPA: YdeI/OmpD-associated family protein [Bacteroidia bacterium]|nr:YdeI/OmpD-associated family protein [Bacteroidia bacterium]HNU32412.1 YdeI/OmpD-associated family protein [Bacteroidia bacterium]